MQTTPAALSRQRILAASEPTMKHGPHAKENVMVNEQTVTPPDAGHLLEDLQVYNRGLRRRTLMLLIVIAFCASVILGFFDLQFRTWDSVLALFCMALLCLPALLLAYRGGYVLPASMLSLVLLVVISVNLYDGDGVRDPGLIAYAIFIMTGALFFGKRAVPYFGIAAIASLAIIVALEVQGRIHPIIGPTRYSILIPLGTLLAASAGIVWATVNNLERHLQRAAASEAELRHNYDLTLEAWARIMEHHDLETKGHSRRVVDLGTRLARMLGVGESEIIDLQRGALLHDIGKLSIPDQILRKPGPLDDAEWAEMHKHPAYAREMLQGIPFLARPAAIAYSHHERWDGGGYPEGLRAEQIPLSARLFAVVDVWDALTSERVYRAAWPRQQALDYLRDNSGSQFDPRIVDRFLRMMAE